MYVTLKRQYFISGLFSHVPQGPDFLPRRLFLGWSRGGRERQTSQQARDFPAGFWSLSDGRANAGDVAEVSVRDGRDDSRGVACDGQ